MKTTPSLGGDPEFFIFIRDKDGKFNIISADKAGLPGKLHPVVFNSQNDRAFFDGVQAEINFAPDVCREVITGNMKNCLLGTLETIRNQLGMDLPIHFAPLPSIEVTPEVIKDTDSECTRFGCSPDMSIYTDEKLKYPDGKVFMTRFSGGHIHIGFSGVSYHDEMQKSGRLLSLIRMMDLFPGIMSVCLSQGKEEKIRRQWYGKAGTYRIQPHGLEYRTLSSFWLVSPQMVSLIYALARDAFTLTYYGKDADVLPLVTEKEIQTIIDNCDIKKATNIWNDILKPMYAKTQIESTPLKDSIVVEYIDKLIGNGGYTSEFNPMKTLNYWSLRNPNPFTPVHGWDRTFGIQGFLRNYDAEVMKQIREE